jgi:hypothetical protein
VGEVSWLGVHVMSYDQGFSGFLMAISFHLSIASSFHRSIVPSFQDCDYSSLMAG